MWQAENVGISSSFTAALKSADLESMSYMDCILNVKLGVNTKITAFFLFFFLSDSMKVWADCSYGDPLAKRKAKRLTFFFFIFQ